MDTRSRPWLVLLASIILSIPLLGFCSQVHDEGQQTATGIDQALLAELRDGGEVLLMRHAITDRSIADVDPTARGGCDQQRPLSQEGVEQATHVGERFRALDLPLGPVLASPFCRTADTAELIAGDQPVPVTETDDLLSLTAAINADQRAAILTAGTALIDEHLGGDDLALMVTHTQNILELTGEEVEEGDIVVLARRDGQVSVLEVVPASRW